MDGGYGGVTPMMCRVGVLGRGEAGGGGGVLG